MAGIMHACSAFISLMFSGVLMGMSNTFATIPGFLGPEIVGILTEKNVSLHTHKANEAKSQVFSQSMSQRFQSVNHCSSYEL